ncbi:large ribosomal subunit protein mL45 [Onthophagus taurus]|uniref:large ribosomal subunit protein mL45 n=1 Tax=Onthophagus taurus TaxID=166361 RepID=UPI000C207EC6|nr:probable 39S ribosomal protein L45, mitochondrial [Onthophagus taurus]
MAHKIIQKLGVNLLSETKLGVFSPILNYQQVRYRRTKHWNPKWKLFRKLKVIKIDLPKYNEKFEDLSEEEVRSKLKEQGLLPPRPWVERQFHLSCTGGVFEPYVPPEGDGKVSVITTEGAKQNIELLSKKTRSMMAIRKIRSFEEEFDTTIFCKQANDIYIKSHQALMSGDKRILRELVTERAYPEIRHNIYLKTIDWKFIKEIEPPRIVHARCTDIITKENIFAQVTVRFHTQQSLAIYDRFGRLMHGSKIIAKDVLEYVVFEKHLANEYGSWRIHDKIIPEWMPPKEPSTVTFKQIAEVVSTKEVEEKEKEVVVTEKSDVKAKVEM